MSEKNSITVFEHDKIIFGHSEPDKSRLKALESFYGDYSAYFSLVKNGVKFNQYVGVIQVGNLTIEILPKADKTSENELEWRNLLIGMLKSVGLFKVTAPSSSSRTIKPNHILDLYFELFLKEVQSLIHGGLVKKYRRQEENCNSLKGNLKFSKHISKNLVHQERFYVSHNTYDVNHILHQIIYKTLILLKDINTNNSLNSLIGSILLDFPEQATIKVSESTFSNIVFIRKTEVYRPAIEIAYLLLMHYHPNLSNGKNHVLALMFDMNKLWEKFVYVSLRKNSNLTVSSQITKEFWKPDSGQASRLRPDIVITLQNDRSIVLDKKWKNLNGKNPSEDDLRQMYAYYDYFGAQKVALIYPGDVSKINKGNYTIDKEKECSVIQIGINKEISNKPNHTSEQIKKWQDEISDKIKGWIPHQ